MRLNEAAMLQAGKYLLSCLTGAIERAMEANYGNTWFAFFKEHELAEEIPIITDEESVKDLDLQACLKILKFRSEFRDVVLNYYGFYDYGTKEELKARRRTFTDTVTRLLFDFRNRYMHLRASTVELESNSAPSDDIYHIETTVDDMIKVAGHFISVKDSQGVSYYDRICECKTGYKKEKNLVRYSVSEMLVFKDMEHFTENDFVRACGELNIPVDENAVDGGFFFYTEDLENTRTDIKKRMAADAKERTAASRKKAVITGVSVAAAAAVTAAVFAMFGKEKTGSAGTGASAEIFKAPETVYSAGFSREKAEDFILELLSRSETAGGDYEGFKELFDDSYKDNAKEKYINSEYSSSFARNALLCKKHFIIPVTDKDGAQGISAVFYGTDEDLGYITARTYTLVRDGDDIKADLGKAELPYDYTGSYPTGFAEAEAEGRFIWRDKKLKDDYTFAEEEIVYEGIIAVQPRIAWENADGSLSVLVRVANGTDSEISYNDLSLRLLASPETLIYEGIIDLRQQGRYAVTDAGKGVNYVVNIKQGSLAEGTDKFSKEDFSAEAAIKENVKKT